MLAWLDHLTRAVALKWVVMNQIDQNVYFLTLFCEFLSSSLKECHLATETLSFPEHTFELGYLKESALQDSSDENNKSN